MQSVFSRGSTAIKDHPVAGSRSLETPAFPPKDVRFREWTEDFFAGPAWP